MMASINTELELEQRGIPEDQSLERSPWLTQAA